VIIDISTAPYTPKDKPDLICPFCDRLTVSYTGIVAIWSHIFHQHKDKNNGERLQAIRQLGDKWRAYYIGRTHRGKHDPTMVKLEQITHAAFNWEDVISWSLR
jgi:hypothetical protein